MNVEALEKTDLQLALEKLDDHFRFTTIALRAIVEEQHLIIKHGFHIVLTIRYHPNFQTEPTPRTYMLWGISEKHVTLDLSGFAYDGWTSAELIERVFDPLNHYPRR